MSLDPLELFCSSICFEVTLPEKTAPKQPQNQNLVLPRNCLASLKIIFGLLFQPLLKILPTPLVFVVKSATYQRLNVLKLHNPRTVGHSA